MTVVRATGCGAGVGAAVLGQEVVAVPGEAGAAPLPGEAVVAPLLAVPPQAPLLLLKTAGDSAGTAAAAPK